MAVRDRYVDIKALLRTEAPVIIDGGANDGRSILHFLGQYQAPTIHAFEPIPALVTHLNRLFGDHPRITIHGAALGAEAGTIGFNIVNNLVSSSILTPTALTKSIHGEKVEIREVVDVPLVRLDDVMGPQEVDLFKLDLQGYELEAFKGARSVLQRTKIISTEVEFVPLYDGQPLFGDIDVFLRAEGFRLLNIYELYTQPNGQLTVGDATYLNSRCF
jgi:FkbM family methyltransferase